MVTLKPIGLRENKTSIDDFVTKNESKFSLFGWALKLFSK